MWYDKSTNNHYTLKRYIKRSITEKNEKNNFGREEMALYMDIRNAIKKESILITEMITLRQMIDKFQRKELYYIINNIQRIVLSLRKQRMFVVVVKIAFETTKPKKEEWDAVADLVKSIDHRIEYLNSVPIPENLMLTPMWEYIQILGGMENFHKDVYKVYQNYKSMIDDRYEGWEMTEDYVNNIMSVVKEHNLDTVYLERLNKYIQKDQEAREKRKKEQETERIQKEKNDTMHAINDFSKAFRKCLIGLQGNEQIHVGSRAIEQRLGRHDRNCAVILCCYINQKKRMSYSYVTNNEGYTHCKFSAAKTYKSIEEAEKFADEFNRKYPERTYLAVDFASPFSRNNVDVAEYSA